PRQSSVNKEQGPPQLLVTAGLVVAGELGFEPRQADPESAVLPLHHSPNALSRKVWKKNDSIGSCRPPPAAFSLLDLAGCTHTLWILAEGADSVKPCGRATRRFKRPNLARGSPV